MFQRAASEVGTSKAGRPPYRSALTASDSIPNPIRSERPLRRWRCSSSRDSRRLTSANGSKSRRVQSAFGTPRMSAHGGRGQPPEPRRGQSGHLPQEGSHEIASGLARAELPAADDRHQHRRLGSRQREQVRPHAQVVTDERPRVQVRVGILVGVDDTGAVEHLEDDLGEREEGLEQVLLVDRRTPCGVPVDARVVLNQPPDRGVHEADVTHVRIAAGPELQATGVHDVEMELGRLVQPALGVGLEPGRQAEDLDAPPAGVRGGQRRRVQRREHVRTPACEPLLTRGHELGVHPRGWFVPGVEEGGERGIGHLVLLDDERPKG